MKRNVIRFLALVLAAFLLAGCSDAGRVLGYFRADYVAHEDMVYTRPDIQAIDRALDDAIEASQRENLEEIIDRIYAYYDLYDDFYTNYSLADVRYCADLTDIYWEDAYNFCLENSAEVGAGLEELYYALAKSPCRQELEGEDYFGEGYFDSYEGENSWDAEFTALLEQESRLESRYYALSEASLAYDVFDDGYYEACGKEKAELLVELIRVRQDMAAYWGYEDYVRFANDFNYYRDYSVEDAADYFAGIRRELVPLYDQVILSDHWDAANVYCTEKETFDYVRKASRAMGGTVRDAFDLMDWAGLYDIARGENKYSSSFEVYLIGYEEPFIFMNPGLTAYDKLTFSHEFGHFCNDYASYGSYVSADVMEVFSQSMEYLCLLYGDAPEELKWVKLADSLCLYVEQAAFAEFEQRMYGLEGDALTVDALRSLYSQVAAEYGCDAADVIDWEFVTIDHYYVSPMYIISYVFSNDAAMQLYQMELEEPGAGLACLEENLDTQAYGFMEFLESAKLQSPFAPGRLEAVRAIFEDVLE